MDMGIGISYGDPIDTGLDILQQDVRVGSRLLRDPDPQAMVECMGESSVNLQLKEWTSVDDYWQTFGDLKKRVK